MREIKVYCEWKSEHTIEVPDDTPLIRSNDLQGVLDASDGEDVTPENSELIDWRIADSGPVVR